MGRSTSSFSKVSYVDETLELHAVLELHVVSNLITLDKLTQNEIINIYDEPARNSSKCQRKMPPPQAYRKRQKWGYEICL